MVFQRLRAFVRGHVAAARRHPYVAAVRRHPYFVAVRSHPYVTAAVAAVRDHRDVYVLSLQVIAFVVAVQFFLAGADVMQARYEERYWAALKAAELAEKLAEMTPLEQEVFGLDEPVVVTPTTMGQWDEQPDSEKYWPERPRYTYKANGEKVPMLGPRKPQVVNPEEKGPWIERGWSTGDDESAVDDESTVDDEPPVVEASSADDDGTQSPGTEESTIAEPEMGTSSTWTTTPIYEVPTTPPGDLTTMSPGDLSTLAQSAVTTFIDIATTVTAESATTNSVLTDSVRTRESITSVTVIDSKTDTRAGHSGPTTIIMTIPELPTIVTLAMSPDFTAIIELEAIANSATDPITSGIAGTLAGLKNMASSGGATFADPEKLGEPLVEADGYEWWTGSTQELIDFIHQPRIYNQAKDRVGWSRAASDRFWAETEKQFSDWVFGERLLATSKGLLKRGNKQYSLLEETLDWLCRTAMPREWLPYGLAVMCLSRDSWR